MNKLFYQSAIASLIVFSPILVTAQGTSSPGVMPDTFMPRVSSSTESVEHGEVTLDLGIQRRFSSSPQVLEEVDLGAKGAINSNRLQMFVRHIALTEPVDRIDIGERDVTVTMPGPAKLFGLIPTSVDYKVTASFDPELNDVTTTINSGWWSRLASKRSPSTVSAEVTRQVKQAEYLSLTQLKATILKAIVTSVGA